MININVLKDNYSSLESIDTQTWEVIDAQGGVAVWDISIPDNKVLFAYNPILCTAKIYKSQGSGESITLNNGRVLYFDAMSTDTCIMPIYEGVSLLVTLSVEAYSGSLLLDLAPIAQALFTHDLDILTTYKTTLRLALWDRNITLNIVNAVAQIGEPSEAYIGGITTKAQYLTHYSGYPLSYVAESIITEVEDIPYSVQDGCVPVSPFYVRWLNAQGGVDYWMFGRAQAHNVSVSKTEAYDIYTPDTATARTNRRAYGATTKNTITVGAEGVSDNWEVVQRLPLSPIIEYYDKQTSKWIGITVAKFDGSIRLDHYTHSIEITFDLPTINTQF